MTQVLTQPIGRGTREKATLDNQSVTVGNQKKRQERNHNCAIKVLPFVYINVVCMHEKTWL